MWVPGQYFLNLFLVRSPSYVYIEKTPSASDKKILDESALRPLPSVIYVGQRVEADLVPNQMAVTYVSTFVALINMRAVFGRNGFAHLCTSRASKQRNAFRELVISRPARMVFNFTVGSGAQVVLLGRQSVPPSLYVHDFYKPLKASQVRNTRKRNMIDISYQATQ